MKKAFNFLFDETKNMSRFEKILLHTVALIVIAPPEFKQFVSGLF